MLDSYHHYHRSLSPALWHLPNNEVTTADRSAEIRRSIRTTVAATLRIHGIAVVRQEASHALYPSSARHLYP